MLHRGASKKGDVPSVFGKGNAQWMAVVIAQWQTTYFFVAARVSTQQTTKDRRSDAEREAFLIKDSAAVLVSNLFASCKVTTDMFWGSRSVTLKTIGWSAAGVTQEYLLDFKLQRIGSDLWVRTLNPAPATR
jgi:hypothetical protein